MSLYRELENTSIRYNSKDLIRAVIVSRKSNDSLFADRKKAEVFFMLRDITFKNINNFFKLARFVPKDKMMHTEDDMAGEAFLILMKCIKGYKLDMISKGGFAFILYYNKALTRAFVRLIEKTYKKQIETKAILQKPITLSREVLDAHLIVRNAATDVDFLRYYYERFGLTEQEQRLIEAKVERVKIDDFIEKEREIIGCDFTRIDYYKVLNSTKEKLSPLKNDYVE